MAAAMTKLAAWWQRQPLKLLWLLVLLTAAVIPLLQRGQPKPGEFYPFSNFPMYSSFSPSTYYVYVTDLRDQPVPVTLLTGKVLSNLKKQYDTELKQQKKKARGISQADLPPEARREAGGVVLNWLLPFAHPDQLQQMGGLRLKEVTITYEGNEIRKRELDVGEVRVP